MKKFLLLLLIALPSWVSADCYCPCINGQNQPICDSAIELRPLCSPRACPLEPPSVKPINPPTIPPIGTETCIQELVWDHNYGKYVWKQVCY